MWLKKNSIVFLGIIAMIMGRNMTVNMGIVILLFTILYVVYIREKSKREKEFQELFYLLERTNEGYFDIDFNDYTESEYSKLRNTIQKTVLLLKEQTQYLNKDRIVLKDNLADVSHQIRTPLTSISLMLESIIDDKDMDEDKKEEFINKIYKKVDDVNHLIEVLLKISKFDASSIVFHAEEVKVVDLLEDSKDTVEALADKKNISIQMNIEEGISLLVDRKWQVEAMGNILKNCVEHSPENGTIVIKSSRNNFYTEISICDEGCGIKKENINRIFDRFYKSENSNGFGIGLNLAKTIIEKENGNIFVESKVGEYTKFIIKYNIG